MWEVMKIALHGCKHLINNLQLQVKVMDWTIESIDDTMVKISHPTFRTGVGNMALPYMSDTFDVLRYSSM